jgi:hypothetical protein
MMQLILIGICQAQCFIYTPPGSDIPIRGCAPLTTLPPDQQFIPQPEGMKSTDLILLPPPTVLAPVPNRNFEGKPVPTLRIPKHE